MEEHLKKQRFLMHGLTYAGALPFVVFNIMLLLHFDFVLSTEFIYKAFLTYGAIIMSFLAGMHWGIAITMSQPMSVYLLLSSNVVAILAWICLILNIHFLTLILLGILYLYQLVIDCKLAKDHLLTKGFLLTRIVITIIVCICFISMTHHHFST